MKDSRALIDLQARGLAEPDDLGVEAARLPDRALGEVAPPKPRGEAEVVLDPRALPRLPSRGVALDDERREPFGGPVHGGGESRGAAADDDQVVRVVSRPRGQSHSACELENR